MQKMTTQTPATERQYFGEQNEQQLFGIITQDFQQKLGSGLTTTQTNRLGRTLEHYMQEVWDVNGPMPIQALNREVVAAVARDFTSYLRRGELAPTIVASQRIVSDPANQPQTEMAAQRLLQQQGAAVPPRPTFESNLLMDTGSRFEQLQQERLPPAAPRPAPPNFSIPVVASGDEQSAISLYEQAKKMRQVEITKQQEDAQRLSGVQTATGTAVTDVNPLVRFMSPPSIQNDAQSNPTLAQPIAAIAPTPRSTLPQDFLIKQDDIINYKETEHNLILYSADRDWLTNSKENRYSFSVTFDPANNKHGFTMTPSSTKKFKNISRIELVKAILPSEGLQNLVSRVSGPAYDTTSKINVLSYPYVLVHIPELDTNNYGTDNNIDNSFAVLQYDANWYTDTTNLSDGYLGMIPKFMKCQKVYQPTPLATLTKLSIELQRPDGKSISASPDTLTIQNIYASSTFPGSFVYNGLYSGVTLASGSVYYLIQTTEYFNQWMFQKGNRIQLKGINPAEIAGTMAAGNFADYMQRDEGLLIVGVGKNSASGPDLPNSIGYANVIVVEAPFAFPTAATPDVQPFGGSAIANSDLATALSTTTFTGAKLINLTHQTNVVLRIITRELDPAARVRPDNL
jgi:hypothetical protein